MSEQAPFKLRTPELEAQIYYLSTEEGGRHRPVFSGYRGQFYYDKRDWDAPQQFLDKTQCSPGETVKVYLQTLSPYYHYGKFYVGKEFETREGGRVVGRGTITRIIRKDFEYWDRGSFLQEIGSALQPYAGKDLKGFKEDCEYYLKQTGLFTGIKYHKGEDLACMLTIECRLKPTVPAFHEVSDKVIDTWLNKLAFGNQKMKVDYSITSLNAEPWSQIKEFNLYFATWHECFVTGVIKVLV